MTTDPLNGYGSPASDSSTSEQVADDEAKKNEKMDACQDGVSYGTDGWAVIVVPHGNHPSPEIAERPVAYMIKKAESPEASPIPCTPPKSLRARKTRTKRGSSIIRNQSAPLQKQAQKQESQDGGLVQITEELGLRGQSTKVSPNAEDLHMMQALEMPLDPSGPDCMSICKAEKHVLSQVLAVSFSCFMPLSYLKFQVLPCAYDFFCCFQEKNLTLAIQETKKLTMKLQDLLTQGSPRCLCSDLHEERVSPPVQILERLWSCVSHQAKTLLVAASPSAAPPVENFKGRNLSKKIREAHSREAVCLILYGMILMNRTNFFDCNRDVADADGMLNLDTFSTNLRFIASEEGKGPCLDRAFPAPCKS